MNNCKYCGKPWGEHYGAGCYSENSVSKFVPLGTLITDICERCGVALEEHYHHKFCPTGGDFKAPPTPSILTLLPEELFEL